MKKYFIITAILALMPLMVSAEDTDIEVNMKLNKTIEVIRHVDVDLGAVDLYSLPEPVNSGDNIILALKADGTTFFRRLSSSDKSFIDPPARGEICVSRQIIENPTYGTYNAMDIFNEFDNIISYLKFKSEENGVYCYYVGAQLNLYKSNDYYTQLGDLEFDMTINLVPQE